MKQARVQTQTAVVMTTCKTCRYSCNGSIHDLRTSILSRLAASQTEIPSAKKFTAVVIGAQSSNKHSCRPSFLASVSHLFHIFQILNIFIIIHTNSIPLHIQRAFPPDSTHVPPLRHGFILQTP